MYLVLHYTYFMLLIINIFDVGNVLIILGHKKIIK